MATREEQLAYQREWMARRRAEFFKDKFCANCGDIFNLELNHIDPSQKVSHKIWSWSKERREAELAKCEVLCNSCHKEVTAYQLMHPCGTKAAYNGGCRCRPCKDANALAMRRYRNRVK